MNKMKLNFIPVFLALLINTDLSHATSPRKPRSVDDVLAINKNLKNTSLPVTFTDDNGVNIVTLHLKYGLEEEAFRYIKNASKEEIKKINSEEIFLIQ